jgi:hypothetical protein
VQGTRTFAEQAALYAATIDNDPSTPVVTRAKPGDSFHQYGLAFDVVPVAYKGMKDWNPSGPYWAQIGMIGESLGLTWGGRWSDPDKPHFHLAAAPLAELKAYWEKFRQVMPIEITPTIGAGAIIALLALAWFFFLKPRLERSGML